MIVCLYLCFMLVSYALLAVASAHAHHRSLAIVAVKFVVEVVALWRLLDIVQANVNMHLFDHIRVVGEHHVTSVVRSSVLSIINYFEVVGWFGLLYWTLELSFSARMDGPIDALYAAAMAQLTVGFGDFAPTTALSRLVVTVHSCISAMFALFAVGRFASLLPRVGEQKSPPSGASAPPAAAPDVNAGTPHQAAADDRDGAERFAARDGSV